MAYPDYTIKADDFITDSDLSLRDTFYYELYGNEKERPRGTVVVIQKLLRDEKGAPIKSPYTYKLTGEGKHSERGPNTTRTGYLCDEYLARVQFRPASRMIMDEKTWEAGKQVPSRDVCYLSWKDKIKEQDVIVFIKTDEDGNPTSPVEMENELIVTKVYPKRLDNGRVEYYAAIVEDQK